MPTAARLFAAIAFTVVAFLASESFKPLLPEGFDPGHMSTVNAVVGFLSGWLVMGRLAGGGYRAAIGSGVRTSAIMVFYALLIHGIYEMLRNAMGMKYDGPMDAIIGVFELIGEYGLMAVKSPEVMITLIVGGVLAAWLSEWAGRQWN